MLMNINLLYIGEWLIISTFVNKLDTGMALCHKN